MDKLNYSTLKSIGSSDYILPNAPERVIQFGEGNFLRAFVDYFFDLANEYGGFNGKVVVVTPNSGRNIPKFAAQDCLYTLYLRGVENGRTVEQRRLISVISRCLSGPDQFDEILKCALNPELKFVVSNTTEAGITFRDTDSLDAIGAAAYPGKLCRFLYERYSKCGMENAAGFILMPCELIEHNGEALKERLVQYSRHWGFGDGFETWLNEKNTFCSTLVDRIVPGYPKEDAARYNAENGYEDDLLDTAEPFGFWAIEGDEAINEILPFRRAGLPILVTPDISFYKQRKVACLNGGHTAMTCAGLLCGLETVGQCMEDEDVSRFLHEAVYNEIIPANALPQDKLIEFSDSVMDRFRNPFVKHELMSITLNTTSKWKARVLPSLRGYTEAFHKLPKHLCFGFAANLEFGVCGRFEVKDDREVLDFFAAHKDDDVEKLCMAYCKETSFWGEDLSAMDGFVDALIMNIKNIRALGAKEALRQLEGESR